MFEMKKIIALFLTSIVILTLSSCGNTSNTNSDLKGNDEYNISDDSYVEEFKENTTQNNTTQTATNKVETKSKQASNNISNNKTYSVGETWRVNNCWEFTINSVTTHYTCNEFNAETYNKTNRVVVVDYTYKNLGYKNNSQKLEFAFYDFSVSDANGNPSIGSVPCSHEKQYEYIYKGASCNAQVVFAMQNNADISNVTIIVGKSFFADEECNNYTQQTATFKIPVTQNDILSGGKTNNNNNTSSKKKEPQKDETLWEYSEALKFNEYAQKSFDYVKDANDRINQASSCGDGQVKLRMSYYNSVKNKLEYANKYLNKAKKLAEENKDITITNSDYKTAKEDINAAISLCDNLIAYDINETNYKSVHTAFSNNAISLLNQCLGMVSYSLSMVKSFAK